MLRGLLPYDGAAEMTDSHDQPVLHFPFNSSFGAHGSLIIHNCIRVGRNLEIGLGSFVKTDRTYHIHMHMHIYFSEVVSTTPRPLSICTELSPINSTLDFIIISISAILFLFLKLSFHKDMIPF